MRRSGQGLDAMVNLFNKNKMPGMSFSWTGATAASAPQDFPKWDVDPSDPSGTLERGDGRVRVFELLLGRQSAEMSDNPENLGSKPDRYSLGYDA